MIQADSSVIQKYNEFLTFDELVNDEVLQAFDELYADILELKQKLFVLSKNFKYATYEELLSTVKEEFL